MIHYSAPMQVYLILQAGSTKTGLGKTLWEEDLVQESMKGRGNFFLGGGEKPSRHHVFLCFSKGICSSNLKRVLKNDFIINQDF